MKHPYSAAGIAYGLLHEVGSLGRYVTLLLELISLCKCQTMCILICNCQACQAGLAFPMLQMSRSATQSHASAL